MKQKSLFVLPLLSTAVLMTACGSDYDKHDHAVTDIPRSTEVTTVVRNRRGVGDAAEDLVSDVVDDGADIVSDVVHGGRDIIDEAADAVDDAVNDADDAVHDDDNYHAGDDGRTDSNHPRR